MSEKIVYPYIPNSAPETQEEMLRFVGARDTEQLFEEIPEHLRFRRKMNLPDPILDEQGIKKHVSKILGKNVNCNNFDNFMGAGCAQHYVPAICDEIASRAELLTCYSSEGDTDHGKYQIFFEYQSLMAELLDMDFLTFPCYSGGQAVASSLRMACRINGRQKVLLSKSMNPQNVLIAKNYLRSAQLDKGIEVVMVDYDKKTGLIDVNDLKSKLGNDVAAVLVENPNYLGIIESGAKEIADLTKAAGAEFIVYVDPITLGAMEAPSNYGATIAIGDIHSLGLHLYCGGAVAGFIACKDDMKYMTEFKEQVFGITDTVVPGEYGFAPILPERTHYAVRENGKEFTGTQNNLWMGPVATYLSLMGPKGMEEIACTIMTNAKYAAKKLTSIPGVTLKFISPFFKEFVLNFDLTGKTVEEINKKLMDFKIFGGVNLSADYPELGQSALYCVTEACSKESIDKLVYALTYAVSR